MFDGESLFGWWIDVLVLDDNFDGDKLFIVRDGMFVSLGMFGGYLISEDIYENYWLEIEYCFFDKLGNCGILVYVFMLCVFYDMFLKLIEV